MPSLALGPELVAAIALVAGLTEAVKRLVFPDAWQYGRAPMLLAALLAAGAVALGSAATLPPIDLAAAWLAVYTGAVGAHQSVTKAARVVAGTTDTAGPDDERA